MAVRGGIGFGRGMVEQGDLGRPVEGALWMLATGLCFVGVTVIVIVVVVVAVRLLVLK